MSIALSVTIGVIALTLYYAGMIAWDLYKDKLQAETEENQEETIVTPEEEVEHIKPRKVPKAESQRSKEEALRVFSSRGLSPAEFNELLALAETEADNADLKNILIRCDAMEQTPPDNQEDTNQ